MSAIRGLDFLWGARSGSWPAFASRHAAFASAMMLVIIQVGIGIVMKASQSSGTYDFSPSASVTISECFKMSLSTLYFWNECKSRAASGTEPSDRQPQSLDGNAGAPLLAESRRLEYLEATEMKAYEHGAEPGHRRAHDLTLHLFAQYVKREVPRDAAYGFCTLAMFYVLINNSIFVIYKLADPGTIQLTRSGTTFVTALVMVLTLGSRISGAQWIAICLQICGLSVTQYDPANGTIYPFVTYLFLLFQVFLSASSGVYNQALLKADDSSLHANNMILYAAGTFVNLICHITIRCVKEGEPGFFEGYNSAGAVMVIVNNVLIGLAMTAVYKYADAVIKCFATAIATGILLYISPILFATKLHFLVIPGTIVVFLASWLYLTGSPKPDTSPSSPRTSPLFRIPTRVNPACKPFLALATVITVTIVTIISHADYPLITRIDIPIAPSKFSPSTSPFAKTMAVVRINDYRPDRLPIFKHYEPFFHTVHVSMPDFLLQESIDFQNATHDQYPGIPDDLEVTIFENTYTNYKGVADTMRMVLDTMPDIEGILFFHFDAWVIPMMWQGFDTTRIRSYEQSCRDPTVDDLSWPAGDPRGNFSALRVAQQAIKSSEMHMYHMEKVCSAWSDIYYVPRTHFAAFVALAEIYLSAGAFQEFAIPSILTMIDEYHRPDHYQSIRDDLKECWGNCCDSVNTPEELLGARCGHKIHYPEAPHLIKALINKLDEDAAAMNQQ